MLACCPEWQAAPAEAARLEDRSSSNWADCSPRMLMLNVLGRR